MDWKHPLVLCDDRGFPPFVLLQASGSEFEEMFVGVGARRIRDLFQEVSRADMGGVVLGWRIIPNGWFSD